MFMRVRPTFRRSCPPPVGLRNGGGVGSGYSMVNVMAHTTTQTHRTHVGWCDSWKVVRRNQTLPWRVGEGQRSVWSSGVTVWCHDLVLPWSASFVGRLEHSRCLPPIAVRLQGRVGTLPTLHEVVSESRYRFVCHLAEEPGPKRSCLMKWQQTVADLVFCRKDSTHVWHDNVKEKILVTRETPHVA